MYLIVWKLRKWTACHKKRRITYIPCWSSCNIQAPCEIAAIIIVTSVFTLTSSGHTSIRITWSWGRSCSHTYAMALTLFMHSQMFCYSVQLPVKFSVLLIFHNNIWLYHKIPSWNMICWQLVQSWLYIS